ncbi:peroxiredoxin family protein [Candidatus Korarchaeum cryptofilum]|jgi:peroxiredoxin family protein|uniref:Peroxiredoxin family protein n=1 Tax=Candidatus Korarchaeum cryptofilum TaxID=498846 RepID=A0A3R9WZ78_9CREN|nr:DsrE/DsrF/DrsH-like family protein [Candidatus Korarchaeum cryptofilum]RSN70024.1 peroxiredoxin family protein [Candidatus Korarchaeum cryptofilum]
MGKAKKLLIIASKGTLDMAYPPLILAQVGAAMGLEVGVFFTFWGLNIIRKDTVDKLKISPVGNPALGMPNILGILPGMTSLATSMMKKRIESIKMASIRDMIKECKELGVKFYACSNTVELMGLKREQLIDEVDDIVGATAFLEMASEDAIVLFI